MQAKTDYNNPDLTGNLNGFSIKRASWLYGGAAALAMALYLFIINMATENMHLGLRFAKYFIMIPFFVLAFNALKKRVEPGHYFKNGIRLAMGMSVMIGLILGVANILLAAIKPELGFEVFLNENDTFGNTMTNSIFLAFETFVVGMIISFLMLQFLKGEKPE